MKLTSTTAAAPTPAASRSEAAQPGAGTINEFDHVFTIHAPKPKGWFKYERNDPVVAAWRVGDQGGYTSADQVLAAAKTFSQGEMPGVVAFQTGDRYFLRGLQHRTQVMWGVNPTGVMKEWKFDDYDLKGATSLRDVRDGVLAIVDDNLLLQPNGRSTIGLR